MLLTLLLLHVFEFEFEFELELERFDAALSRWFTRPRASVLLATLPLRYRLPRLELDSSSSSSIIVLLLLSFQTPNWDFRMNDFMLATLTLLRRDLSPSIISEILFFHFLACSSDRHFKIKLSRSAPSRQNTLSAIPSGVFELFTTLVILDRKMFPLSVNFSEFFLRDSLQQRRTFRKR